MGARIIVWITCPHAATTQPPAIGDFLRLKSIELGYTFPEQWLNIKNLSTRFYASGQNLFTISKFDLWDNEMGGNGLGYPPQRIMNIGLQINF